VRQRGSHVVMQVRTGDGTTTVPVPLHRELRIGTLQSIIRQSGIPRAELNLWSKTHFISENRTSQARFRKCCAVKEDPIR
jgi:hypothetical protein